MEEQELRFGYSLGVERARELIHKAAAPEPDLAAGKKVVNGTLKGFSVPSLQAGAEESPLRMSLLDMITWRRLFNRQHKTLSGMADNFRASVPLPEMLHRDLYQYLLDGEVRESETSTVPNKDAVLEAFRKVEPALKPLLEKTKNDFVASSVVADSMFATILEAYREVQRPQSDERPDNAQKDQGGDGQAPGGDGTGEGPNGGLQQAIQEGLQAVEEKLRTLDRAEQLFGATPKADDPGVQENGNPSESFGTGQDHSAATEKVVDPKQYLDLVDLLTTSSPAWVPKVLQHLGRMRRSFQAVEAAVLPGYEGRGYNRFMGGRIDRLPDDILWQLCDPDLSALVLRDLVADEAPQATGEEKRKADRGPVFILVDDSGSMYSGNTGGSHIPAKALAIISAQEAMRQGRDVWVARYSSVTDMVIFHPTPRDPAPLLVFLQHAFRGGTATKEAVKRAVHHMKKYYKSHTYQRRESWGDTIPADILIITDGLDREGVNTTWKQELLDKHQIKVFGIMITEDEIIREKGKTDGRFVPAVAVSVHTIPPDKVSAATMTEAAETFWRDLANAPRVQRSSRG